MTHTVVAYASAHGSTRGIAERIADVLRTDGHSVSVHSLADARDVADFDHLVVGSAIHDGQWLPDAEPAALQLATRATGRVWAFSVSSVGTTTSFLANWVAGRLRPHVPEPHAVTQLRANADVRSHRFFAGAISPGDWPGFGRIVFRLMGGRYRDARDWNDIDRWAQQISAETASPD